MWELLESLFDMFGDAFFRNYFKFVERKFPNSEKHAKKVKVFVSGFFLAVFFVFLLSFFFFIEGNALLKFCGAISMIICVFFVVLFVVIGYILNRHDQNKRHKKRA